MNKEKVVEQLNEDLQLEFRSMVQYVCHIAGVRGAKYQQLLAELETHLGQELDHALKLARQVDFLGGVPSTHVPVVQPTRDAARALADDLRLEEGLLKRYRQRVQDATDLGLADVAEVLSTVLRQTQDHVRDLRAAAGRPAKFDTSSASAAP